MLIHLSVKVHKQIDPECRNTIVTINDSMLIKSLVLRCLQVMCSTTYKQLCMLANNTASKYVIMYQLVGSA